MAQLEGDVVYPDPSIAAESHVPDPDALRAEAESFVEMVKDRGEAFREDAAQSRCQDRQD